MARIAYFEPVRGLNVYGRELLPELARLDEVDVYTDAGISRLDETVVETFSPRPFEAFGNNGRRYDHLVLQLRNNPFHVPVYDALLAHGGVAVMHEVVLSGIIGAKTLSQGRRLAFLKEVLLIEGLAPFVRLLTRLLLRRPFQGFHYDMNRRAVQRSRGVIVHSQDARRRLSRHYASLPVQVIRRGVPRAASFEPEATKRLLELSGRFPIVASFGVVHSRKRIAQALEAFAGIVSEFPQAVYVLVGPLFQFDLDNLVVDLGLEGRVLATGRVDDETFNRYLSAADIGVNLRYPLEGETSSTALRIMSYGKPTLVTNAGSLAELPDSCVVRVDPGPHEVIQVRHALLELARSHSWRREMGNAALAYVRQHHTWEGAARMYHEFLEQLASIGNDQWV